MQPNLSFIHSCWASLCAWGSSDWWSADLPRGAPLHHQRLSSDENQERWWIEDGFSNLIQSFQVSGHAFWSLQFTGQLSGLYQQNHGQKAGYLCHFYLDDMLIYMKDTNQACINAVWWVLELPRKNSLFANHKKCCFHQDEVRFLEYVVSAQEISMENEKIKAVRNWPEPKSVWDIQVFIGFPNFYWRFIQGFSKIAALLTLMLKTTGLLDSALRRLEANGDEVIRSDHDDRNLSKSKKSKNVKSEILMHIEAIRKPMFLTFGARKAFNQLKQAFTKAPILQYFDPECLSRLKPIRLYHRKSFVSADFWLPDLQSGSMAPSSLIFGKNDTTRNKIQNL